MRGKNFSKEEIDMVRNYADTYSMNLAKEKLAPAISKTKQWGGSGKAQINLTEEHLDDLATWNKDQYLEYNTVGQTNYKIREGMLDDLRAQGLGDDIIEAVDDELYQLSHDRTGGPFGGTTTSSHPANWVKRAGDEIEMITGKKFDTKFYENYGNEVLSHYKKKPDFQAGGVVGQLHLNSGGPARVGRIGYREGGGYKVGELKHAGLSNSRLQEIAIEFPDLAEEVARILAERGEDYASGGIARVGMVGGLLVKGSKAYKAAQKKKLIEFRKKYRPGFGRSWDDASIEEMDKILNDIKGLGSLDDFVAEFYKQTGKKIKPKDLKKAYEDKLAYPHATPIIDDTGRVTGGSTQQNLPVDPQKFEIRKSDWSIDDPTDVVKKSEPQIGKFTKAEALIARLKNTLKESNDPYVKKNFPNWIKEIEANPKLADNENVWKNLGGDLPENQRFVVHSDDSVDFFTQSEFGPHNIQKTLDFQKKHGLTREQANTILRMEPEDRVLEMKRLETIADRSKTKHASGGIAGQLHLNEGGRARFANGSPAVDPRMLNTYAENRAANEAQRQANFEYLKQNTRQTGFVDPRILHENLDQATGGARGVAANVTGAPTASDISAAIAANTPNKTPDQLIAEQAYTDLGGGITSAHKAPISSLNLATSPESRITNEAQANMLAELMAPGSTLPQQYQKPSFQERMGGESWEMLSDNDQYRISQEYPGQTPPRRNPGFIPSSFAKGGLAQVLGV
jgi:hypothetical protein